MQSVTKWWDLENITNDRFYKYKWQKCKYQCSLVRQNSRLALKVRLRKNFPFYELFNWFFHIFFIACSVVIISMEIRNSVLLGTLHWEGKHFYWLCYISWLSLTQVKYWIEYSVITALLFDSSFYNRKNEYYLVYHHLICTITITGVS